jgi:hypothetical protein
MANQPPVSYREYEDYLLDRVFEAREKYQHARTSEEKESLADAYRDALHRLADLIATGKIPGTDEAAHGGGSSASDPNSFIGRV